MEQLLDLWTEMPSDWHFAIIRYICECYELSDGIWMSGNEDNPTSTFGQSGGKLRIISDCLQIVQNYIGKILKIKGIDVTTGNSST